MKGLKNLDISDPATCTHTFCRVQSCIKSAFGLRIKEISGTAIVKFGKSVLQVNFPLVSPRNTSPGQANFLIWIKEIINVCASWTACSEHGTTFSFFSSAHCISRKKKKKKRAGHDMTLEENAPFLIHLLWGFSRKFFFNTNWKKSLICRKSQLFFFLFSSQIIFMALHIQFCCWQVRKKWKEMFLQFNLQLLKHDFNLQHKLHSGQKSKKKLLSFHLLHRCKANTHAKLSSSHLQLCHSCLQIWYK